MGNCVSFNKESNDDVYIGLDVEQYIKKNKHLKKNIIKINANNVMNNPNISNNEKILACIICSSNEQLVKLLTNSSILEKLSTNYFNEQIYIKLLQFHLTNNVVDEIFLEINNKIFQYNLANLTNKPMFIYNKNGSLINSSYRYPTNLTHIYLDHKRRRYENLKLLLYAHIHDIYPTHSDLFDYFKFGTLDLIKLIDNPIRNLDCVKINTKHLRYQNEYKFMKLYDPSLDNFSNDEQYEQNKEIYKLLKLCDESNFINFAVAILNNNIVLDDVMFANLTNSKNFDNYKNSSAYVNYLILQNHKIMSDIKKKEQYLNHVNNTNTIDKLSTESAQSNQLSQSNPLNPPNTPEKSNEPNQFNESNKVELTNCSANKLMDKIVDQLTNTPLSYNEIINLAITEENWLNNNIKNTLLLEKIILDCPECLLLNINPKKILMKNFKIINVLTHFNDSELLLFFILSNKLNIFKKYKFHDNLEYQALNKLFYEIFTKLNDNCSISVKYEYDAFEDYHVQLTNLFDEQYQTF